MVLQREHNIFSYLHRQLQMRDRGRFPCPQTCNADSLQNMLASCGGLCSIIIDEANLLAKIPTPGLETLPQLFRQLKHMQKDHSKQGIASIKLLVRKTSQACES